jgi:hypothetical protein
MKLLQQTIAWLLVAQLSGMPGALVVLAQPVIIQPGAPFGNQPPAGSGIENLRVSQQSADGTEAQLTMDYTYDGFAGPIAQVLPVIGKKGQKGVSAWFGSDPVTVGRGRGTITLRVRYFSDEPGVPATFTSDQLRILILNKNGTAILSAVPFLKNMNWGSPNAPKRNAPRESAPTLAVIDAVTAQKLANEKRAAEEKAREEAALREKARLQAEAEVKTRKQAEAKALAEASAREEAQKKAQAEAERITRENQKAQEIHLAQEEDRKRAEAEERARQQAEAKALADAQAKTEAKARAEAEAKKREEERRLAEAKRIADEKARDQARLKAEAEAKRLAEEKRLADEKALAEAKARKEAEEKAWQEALAQAKAELAAKKLNEEKIQAEELARASAPPKAAAGLSMEIAQEKKTKITNVDVVNRSTDRTQMTFGVEFEYKDQIAEPMLGIDVLRESEPQTASYFMSRPAEIGKSRRNFALFPVKFQPPPNVAAGGDFATDKVLVYLTDKPAAHRYNIFPATMLLRWRAAGSAASAAPLASANAVEIDDFKQNDPSTGYISVKYNLLAGKGKLRARVFDAKLPDSAAYFTMNAPEIAGGRGVQLIEVRIDPDA